MAEYGYTYRSSSTYNTSVRKETRGPIIKPFVPFVPKTNGNNSEGHVTKKTIVPVTSKPYGDDYNSHIPVTEAYPSRDDDKWHHQTSPILGSPPHITKVQNEANRPQRFSPVASTDWGQSPKATAYNGDYGSNKEGHKQVGSTIRNDNYNGTNGYGRSNKEGHKPIIGGGTIRNDNHDHGYSGTNGYGNKKEGYKPTGLPIRNDGHNGPNGQGGYGDHYNRKEGHKPNYDGYNSPNGGYGDYNKREGYKPSAGFPIRNDKYDGYGKDKERTRPLGSTITQHNNYDDDDDDDEDYGEYGNYNNREGYKPSNDGWSRPKIGSGWTAAPRKGTQLSEPTHDIGQAMELLKKEAANYDNENYHKLNNYDDDVDRSSPLKSWAAPPGNGSHLSELTSKFDKGMNLAKETERLKKRVTGPPQSRSSVPIESAKVPNNKDDYREKHERRDGSRPFGNFNLSSRPRTPPTDVTIIDGRDRDDARRYGHASLVPGVIDSREAEKRFKGTRVW